MGISFIKQIFNGRINRKNYILGLLFFLSIYLLLLMIISLSEGLLYLILYIILNAILAFFSLSLHIRRFHDRGDTGWGVLFFFLPIVNAIFFALLLFEKGDDGKNEFGKKPQENVKFFDAIFNKPSVSNEIEFAESNN